MSALQPSASSMCTCSCSSKRRDATPVHGQGPYSSRYSKFWPSIFETECAWPEDERGPWVESPEADLDPDLDDFDDRYLERFQRDWKGLVPSPVESSIGHLRKAQCEGQTLECKRDRSWLNDYEHTTERSRSYPDRLTAQQLLQHLKAKRFGLTRLPDADRRLLYIPDLDIDFVRVLARTATFSEVHVLRDFISNHLDARPLFRVKIPSTFTIFRLELHLPYFALRRTLPQHQHLLGSRVGHGKLRKPVDVSFLGNPDSKNDSGHWNIHHARFSLVVAGPNCFKWNAYAFVDTRFNETSRDDEDGDQPQTGQEEDSRDSYGMQEDPIASDGEGEGATVDAGMPIWDPRAYFLRNIGYRSQQAYEEWDHIFRHLDERIQQHDENHPHALCHQVYDIDPNESQVEFAWTVRTMNVLRMLRGNLKTATSAFDRFCAPDGDINYFIDLMEPRARSWLEEVRDYTGQLTDLVQKFFDLDESLRERCRHLELRMSVDSNRLSLESNKLSLQSNKLSSEGHALNLSAHSLTLEAKQLTRETYQVNLEMSEVAYENQRTNYLSLSMNQIWLPISIAIAYFGTPQETFPFKRTPAMMLVCVVGIMIGANLFVLLLIRMRHTKWYKSLWKWLQTYRVVRLVVDCVDGKYAHSENTRSARASAGSLNSIELTPNV